MSKDTYMSAKRKWASILSAVLLSGFQLYAFIVGLNIGDNSVAIGATLWFALFLIQMVGNDFAHEDMVFRVGWIFSYLVEIAAGTWAIYALIEIPETSPMLVWLRWGFALGLSGVVALLPERMLIIALTPAKKKPTIDFNKGKTVEPWKSPNGPDKTPAKKPNIFSKFNGAKKYDPLEKPRSEPTYHRSLDKD